MFSFTFEVRILAVGFEDLRTTGTCAQKLMEFGLVKIQIIILVPIGSISDET